MSLIDVLKSKVTKVGGGIVGGSGIVIIALNLMNDKIDSVAKNLDFREAKIMAEVDYKHNSVMTELRHMGKELGEQKTLLEKIDQRIYEMNRKQMYSNLFKGNTTTKN